MDIARAMYKGGKIIHADECDFASYKNLGLLCPFCKQEVYLRKGNIRKPYFAHFHATSSRQVEECELRASVYSTSTKISSFIQDRTQRLEIFQQHFLSMIYVEKNKIIENLQFNNWITLVKRENNQAINNITKVCIDYFLKNYKKIEKLYTISLKDINDKQIMLQQQIALEAMGYLSVQSSYNLLEYLIHYSLYRLYKYKENQSLQKEIITQDIDIICNYATKIIIFNPWIEVLEKIENNLDNLNNFSNLNCKTEINIDKEIKWKTGLDWSFPFLVHLKHGDYLADTLGTYPVTVQVAVENKRLYIYILDKKFTRTKNSSLIGIGKDVSQFLSSNLEPYRSKLLEIGTIKITEVPVNTWLATKLEYKPLARSLNKHGDLRLIKDVDKLYRGLFLSQDSLTIGDCVLCRKKQIGNRLEITRTYALTEN
jgi:hypothetical protein